MSQKQTSVHCPHCNKRVLAQGRKPNHVFHLILTILTLGFWSWVWLLVAIGMIGGYRCLVCGTKV